MTHQSSIALFAGVAGFELGFHRHGFEPALFSEIDPAAQSVLKTWKPLTPITPDVRDIEELPIGPVLLAAGFPCQDISQAGLKAGLEGEKSRLVQEVFRLLRRRPVETMVIENVPNLLRLNGGSAMSALTGALAQLGYRYAWRVVCSSDFGIPQRRRRLFLVGCRRHDPAEVLLADDTRPAIPTKPAQVDITTDSVGFYWHEGRKGWGMAVNAVPPLRAGGQSPTPPAILLPDGSLGIPALSDGERLQGLPVGWTKPSDRVERNARWRLLGNAVTCDVPAWIGGRLAQPGRPRDPSHDTRFDTSAAWPEAGWGTPNGGPLRSPHRAAHASDWRVAV